MSTTLDLQELYSADYPSLEMAVKLIPELSEIRIQSIGDPAILDADSTALFCSVRCPGDLILKTYDLARSLRDNGSAVIGGFHSPMENECLRLLLRGTQPVVICPARSLEGMRLPKVWRGPLAEGRMLVLSPFAENHRRVTAGLAAARNKFVAALAHSILIVHAEPNGKTEGFCREILGWGKPVMTIKSAENANLIRLGARVVDPNNIGDWSLSLNSCFHP